MAELIACDQADVLPDGCPECGGGLHTEIRGGYRYGGWSYCSEDCIADYQERVAESRIQGHLVLRDLLCDCPEACAPRGLPSDADRAQYAAWQAEEVARGD